MELAAAGWKFTGDVKPILEDVDTDRSGEQRRKSAETFLEGLSSISRRQYWRTLMPDQVAARIPFKGTIKNPTPACSPHREHPAQRLHQRIRALARRIHQPARRKEEPARDRPSPPEKKAQASDGKARKRNAAPNGLVGKQMRQRLTQPASGWQ